MTIVLNAANEAQLDSDIAVADAAGSGACQIDITQSIAEISNPAEIALNSLTTLAIDGSDGSDGASNTTIMLNASNEVTLTNVAATSLTSAQFHSV